MADRTVRYTFTGNFANLTAGLATAGRNVTELGTKMTALDKNGAKMRAGLTTLGDAGGKIGLLAAAGVGVAIAVTAKFDKQMSAAAAATNATASELELLRKAAIKAGADTIFSASEAADGITQLGKAGVSTTDILSGGLTGALNLAAAGQISVSEAAETTASTLNQFGLAGDQASRVADVLSASADAAQGGVTDMGQAMKYVGPLASQMGISLEQTAGSIAELASQGILGEQAGTALRGMLASLSSPSNKAADEMAALGISVYDAQGKFVGFDGVAGQLQASLGGLTAAQRDQSLGIIFGNEQLTAARILYSGGAAAVQDWTSKVTDAGHAQERASQLTDNLAGDLEQLKGSFETALIGAGEGSQGPLRSLVQGLTATVDAFNSLPGPAKNAAMALGGVTAILGGGLWFASKAINGVTEMKTALSNLGIAGEKTSRALTLVGQGAAIATGALIGLAIIDQVQSSAKKAGVGVEEMTASLLALQDTSSLPDDLDGLAHSIERLADPNIAQGLQDNIAGVIGFGGGSELANAKTQIQAIDSALANLVVTAGGDRATATFDQLTESAGLSKSQIEDLKDLLPQYGEALTGVANDAKLSGDAQGEMADATSAAAVAAKKAQNAQQELRDELRKQREDARGVAQSFIGLGDSLDDSKASLGQWLRELEKQAEALRNFTSNARTAAKRGLDEGLIQSLNEAGPAGALRMKQLADATDAEIKRANRAWRDGQDAIRDYVNMAVPEKKIRVDASGAFDTLAAIKYAIAQLRDKTITINTVHRESYLNKLSGIPVPGGSADGSTVPKDGGPYGDRYPYLLAPGEEVISNRYGQADRFRPLLKAINAGRLADGGTAGGASLDTRLEIVGLLQQIRDLRRDLDARIQKGKNKGELEIQGLDRRRALLELEAAERDLRRAKNAEEREAREKAREQRKAQADLKAGMGDLFGFLPGREQTIAQQVAATIADFRKQWEAAGGKWSDDLVAWAENAQAAAAEYDRVSSALDDESRHRDALNVTLNEQKAQYDQLTSTMKSFGSSVAANFTGDVFNGQRTETIKGAGGPATAALQQAREELAALRASATGDSVSAAAAAATLIARIRDLEQASEAEMQDREVQVSGLEALRQKLAADTKNAQDFAAALSTLAAKGLDTSGPLGGLYASLAQSGDLLTAQQMADLTAAQIDELEKAYQAREDAAAAVAAQTVQAKYGADQAAMQAAIAQTQAAIDQSTASIELMEAALPVIADNVRAGSQIAADRLAPDIAASRRTLVSINGSINDLARQFGEQSRKDKV